MALYVDPLMPCEPTPQWRYRKSCHLFADTDEELHEFARRHGIWKCNFHENTPIGNYYLLNWSSRWWAVFNGAKALNAKQTVRKRRQIWPHLAARPKVTEATNR